MKLSSILYIVNFYGTPPLYYFEKFIKETTGIKLTILRLPSVRPMKNQLLFEGMYVESDGVMHEKCLCVWFPFPQFVVYAIQYLFNYIFVIYFLYKTKLKKYDVCIGETSFGSSTAVLLKKMKIVRKTVFMNGDALPGKNLREPFYFKTSTKNKAMSKAILIIDKLFIHLQYFFRNIALMSDLVWYPNERVREWDSANGRIPLNHIICPTVMLDYNEVVNNIKYTRERYTVSYFGRLDENAGIDMCLKVIKVIAESIESIKLILVGGGTLPVEYYKKMAKNLGIENNVVFHGYIKDMDEAYSLIKKSRIGLALYNPNDSNVSLYGEPSKPKEYIKLGLPVILTNGGPAVGYDIQKYNAGVVVDYDEQKIAAALIKILNSDEVYKSMQEGVLKYSQVCDYRVGSEALLKKFNSFDHQ